jgi:antirestriction protein ArdC
MTGRCSLSADFGPSSEVIAGPIEANLILWGAVIEREFSGQSWLTFRQALSLSGNVRKGERGTTVVYADPQSMRRSAGRGCEGRATASGLIRITFIMEYIPIVVQRAGSLLR